MPPRERALSLDRHGCPHHGDLCTSAFSRLRRSSHPLPTLPRPGGRGLNCLRRSDKSPSPLKGGGVGEGGDARSSIPCKGLQHEPDEGRSLAMTTEGFVSGLRPPRRAAPIWSGQDAPGRVRRPGRLRGNARPRCAGLPPVWKAAAPIRAPGWRPPRYWPRPW